MFRLASYDVILSGLVDANYYTVCGSVSVFLREIRDPQNTDLSPEILAIELKLGRLLQSVGNLVVRPPNGNYKTYYSELKQRIRSVQLASDLVTYLRRLMFDGGTEQINLAVVRPVFARSQIFGRSGEFAKEVFVDFVVVSPCIV